MRPLNETREGDFLTRWLGEVRLGIRWISKVYHAAARRLQADHMPLNGTWLRESGLKSGLKQHTLNWDLLSWWFNIFSEEWFSRIGKGHPDSLSEEKSLFQVGVSRKEQLVQRLICLVLQILECNERRLLRPEIVSGRIWPIKSTLSAQQELRRWEHPNLFPT